MSIQRPEKLFLSKWAEKGERFDIADNGADHANGRADIETGFPKQTMISVLQGGVPPWGSDHNGILYRITEAIQWMQAGGLANFDQKFSDQKGGYAVGAVIRSWRFPYVFYINMLDGNSVDPDVGSRIEDYWVNTAKPGNNWAILSILSDNTDSISFLDSNFRIVTKVAGARTAVYVRPSTYKDKFLGTPDFPYRTVQEAINVVPDGGTASIYMWFQDEYTLLQDNTMNLADRLSNGWEIGSRKITFIPWGQNSKDEHGNYIDENGFLIDQLQDDLDKAHSSSNIWGYNIVKRPIIHIPVGKDSVNNMTIHGYISGELGSSIEFKNFYFIVQQTSNVGNYQNGAPFHPRISYIFSSCHFSNMNVLFNLYGGWGGATNTIEFSACHITDLDDGTDNVSRKFIGLDEHTTTVTVDLSLAKPTPETFNKGTPDEHTYIRPVANADQFFNKVKNYLGIAMIPIAYKMNDPSNLSSLSEVFYYPKGLKINLALDFS